MNTNENEKKDLISENEETSEIKKALNNEEENKTDEVSNTENITSTEVSETTTKDKSEKVEETIQLEETETKSKKKGWIMIIGVMIIISIFLFASQFLSKNNEKPTEIDYMQYIEGIQDKFEVQVTKNGHGFKEGITWDKEYINDVTIDASKVDLTKAGEYSLTYKIDVKDEKAEDFEKVVKVKVVKEKSKDTAATTDKKADDKKKDDKTNQTKEENKTNSSTSNNNTVSKPSNNGSSNSNSSSNNSSSSSNDNSSISKPSNGSSSSNSSSNNKPTPTPPTHTHDWQPVTTTINHPEDGHYETVTIEEAWDENVYNEYEVSICNQCGADITGNTTAHNKNHALNHEPGGWHSEWITEIVDTIHHEAVTEKRWIVDKEAWTETVTTGYNCSCGATK